MTQPTPFNPLEFDGNEDETLAPAQMRAMRREARAATLAAGDRLGEYEIVSLLGQGAMGVVYRATALHLGRDVAIKVIPADRNGAPEIRERFLREARAAARLAQHPHVVGVHDLGERDDGVWMAMELIEGLSLDEYVQRHEPDQRTVAAILEQIASAAHHAHESGVYHRDIKPGNILVAPEPARVRAYLTDFGLARAAGDGGAALTVTGAVIGTPSFMAPEQARGEAIDRRADVWALGATLFAAVTGRALVGGSSVQEIVDHLLAGETRVEELRPLVDPPLWDVVTRCLQPDPADRYDSAGALAADLARYQAGQPVHAARGHRLRAAAGFARRRGRLIGVTLAVLGAGVTGVVWSASRWAGEDPGAVTDARRERTRAEVLQEAAGAFYALSGATQAHLAALEDSAHGAALPPEALAAALERIDSAAEAVQTRHPGSRLPDAWRGLARCFAGRRDEGRALLRAAAADAGPDPFPKLLLARAELAEWTEAARLPDISYQDAVLRGELYESDAMRAARTAAVAALAGLTSGGGVWNELQHGRELGDYAAALTALVEKRHEDARVLLLPLADDGFVGAEVQLLLGLAQFLTGRFEEAAASWRRPSERGWIKPARWAPAALTSAAVSARLEGRPADGLFAAADQLYAAGRERFANDLRLTQLHGQLLGMWARHEHERGGDARARLDAALTILDRAVQMEPDSSRVRASRALALGLRARMGGPGAAEARARAKEDFDAAIRLAPDNSSARINRGAWYKLEAERAESKGADARDLCDAGLDDLDAGLAIVPRSRAGRVTRAQLLQVLARVAERAGEDPEPIRARALQDLAEVFRFYESVAARIARALIYMDTAAHITAHGGDPRPPLQRAAEDCRAALAHHPNSPNAHDTLGLVHLELARAQTVRGVDPRPTLDLAIGNFTDSLAVRPDHGPTLSNRALANIDRGNAAQRRGRDGGPWYRAAVQDCDLSLARSPGSSSTLCNRGLARQRLAGVALRAGGDPIPVLESAIADYTAALERRPSNGQARNGRALSYKERGEALQRLRQDPRPDYRAALDDFAELLRQRPSDLSARSNRATVGISLATAMRLRGADPRPVLAAAREDCSHAIARKPNYLNAYQNRGAAWQAEADYLKGIGGDPTHPLEEALADFQRALEHNDRFWQAHSGSGWALQQLQRWEEAAAAYDRSLALNPRQAFILQQRRFVQGKIK